MKTYSIVVILAFLASPLFLQGQSKPIPEFNTRHKNIYIELLGSHLLHGINVDMRLEKGRMDGLGFRAGIGGYSSTITKSDTDFRVGLVTFPLEVNHLIGKGKSSLVSGVGLLPIYATASGKGALTDHEYVQGEGFALMGGFMTFGYRLQPRSSGFMMQINWNPLMIRGKGFSPGWIGIGIGMGFK